MYFISIDPNTGSDSEVRASYTDFWKSFLPTPTDAGPTSKANESTPQIALQIIHFPQDIHSNDGYTQSALHENLALRVLRDSSLALDKSITVGTDPSTNEILRASFGMTTLPINVQYRTWNKNSGALWALDFKTAATALAAIPNNNIIGRSQFGDVQFLHCMATAEGEAPSETSSKVMLWTELMYRLSTAKLKSSDQLLNVTTSRGDFSLKRFFNANTQPTISQKFSDLIAPLEKYEALDIKRRALGSLLHLVQDSYHTQQTLLNLTDQVKSKGAPNTFKPGTWAHLGDIEIFHTRKHPDDQSESKDQTDFSNFKTTDDWNGVWGARDAIAQSAVLIDFWRKGTLWEDGVEAWAEACFKVSPTAKASLVSGA